MGGQDRRDPQPGEHRVEIGIRPVASTQSCDRLGDGVIEESVTRGPLPAPKRPNARPRLGEVDELEVQRERRDDGFRIAELERIELRLQAFAFLGLVAATEVDRRETQPLDEVVDALPGLLRDDLAQERSEQPDLERQRVPRARRTDTAGFRGPGRSCSLPRGAHVETQTEDDRTAR